MLTKKELKISEEWEYFDRYGKFPDEKKRIDLTLPSKQIDSLRKKAEETNKSMSKIVAEALIGKGIA